MRKMLKNKVSVLSLFTLVFSILSVLFFQVLTAASLLPSATAASNFLTAVLRALRSALFFA